VQAPVAEPVDVLEGGELDVGQAVAVAVAFEPTEATIELSASRSE
jgi:hypothetical protein